eukprot:11157763-Ditylum_brightwellii.AAC.1
MKINDLCLAHEETKDNLDESMDIGETAPQDESSWENTTEPSFKIVTLAPPSTQTQPHAVSKSPNCLSRPGLVNNTNHDFKYSTGSSSRCIREIPE